VATANDQNLQGSLVTPGWHHVAMVQDGIAGTRKIYVDGILGKTGHASEADGGGDLVFGGSNGVVEPFNGLLDDVRLYARALPADQIQQMAQNPRAVAVPTLAELGGTSIGSAETINISLAGQTPKTVHQQMAWDLTTLPAAIEIGDTIEFWAQATDTNDITGPGVGSSEHHQFHVISETDKQKELLDKLGDYMGKVQDVSDSERDLNARTGTMVKPR
jgi:hypothetical protein